jgi:hypothetical protein
MTAAGVAPALPQPPDPFCGICGTERCLHGLCRMCDSCAECDREALQASVPLTPAAPPALSFAVIRLSAWRTSRRIEDLAVRADYLYEAGIPWDEMREASQALDDLLSDRCICGNRKIPRDSFCANCYRALPIELHDKLKLHISKGYLPYLRQATKFLAELRLRRATAEHSYEQKKQAVE